MSFGRMIHLNSGVTIAALDRVELDDRVEVGPHVTIYDNSFHDLYYRTQLAPSQPVVIEDDVWLAAKCTVLPGCGSDEARSLPPTLSWSGTWNRSRWSRASLLGRYSRSIPLASSSVTLSAALAPRTVSSSDRSPRLFPWQERPRGLLLPTDQVVGHLDPHHDRVVGVSDLVAPGAEAPA